MQACTALMSSISASGFQELGVPVTHSNTDVVCGSDVVFIAVKPHLVPHILGEISQHVTDRHIIVSVAAGVTLATLEEVSLVEEHDWEGVQKISCSVLPSAAST